MRYQYSSRGFKQNFSENPLLLPNGVKLLLIINISVLIRRNHRGCESMR